MVRPHFFTRDAFFGFFPNLTDSEQDQIQNCKKATTIITCSDLLNAKMLQSNLFAFDCVAEKEEMFVSESQT